MGWKSFPLWFKFFLSGAILAIVVWIAIGFLQFMAFDFAAGMFRFTFFNSDLLYFALPPFLIITYTGVLIHMYKSTGKLIKKWYLYLWLLLPILIIASINCYKGFPFNYQVGLPNSCAMFPGLACTEYVVHSSGQVELYIRNGMGDLNINSIALTAEGCISENNNILIKDGESAVFHFKDCKNLVYKDSFCPAYRQGNRFKSDIIVTYTLKNLQNPETRTGHLVTNVVK